MHNRFLKVCSFLVACFLVTTCNATTRENAASDTDKSRHRLRIIRPTDRDALPVGYRVRIGRSGNHLRIVERVPARKLTEDEELDGNFSESDVTKGRHKLRIIRTPFEYRVRTGDSGNHLRIMEIVPAQKLTEDDELDGIPSVVTMPRSIEGTWRIRSHSEKFGVRIFRGGVGELRFTEDGYGVQPVFLLRQHAFTSRSFYPQKLENEHDTGDLIVRSVALAKEIFPCMNLDTEGFVSNHLALCPFDTDYSKFYPPFLTLPHNMTSSGVDALYFLHKGFGLQGSHEFAKFLANCTGNIKARTLVYVNKNSRQFESGKMDEERRIAEGISEPIKVIVSYPLTQPIPVLAIQGNNYMIFGSKEIRVVLEKMVDQDSSGETFSWIRINVFPSLWDPSTKRQLFEIDEFLKFCRSGRINLGH